MKILKFRDFRYIEAVSGSAGNIFMVVDNDINDKIINTIRSYCNSQGMLYNNEYEKSVKDNILPGQHIIGMDYRNQVFIGDTDFIHEHKLHLKNVKYNGVVKRYDFQSIYKTYFRKEKLLKLLK